MGKSRNIFVMVKLVNIENYVLFDNLILLNNDDLACTARDENGNKYILILDSRKDYSFVRSSIESYGRIYCLVTLSGNKFASANGCDIIIWTDNNYFYEIVLKGHQDIVLSLAFSNKDNLLVSGSYDRSIKL
jgi:WD40 repeat protein